MNIRMIYHTLYGLCLAILATFVPLLFAIHYKWINEVNMLEIAAVFTSYVCTYLCIVQIRTQYLWGGVSTVLLVFMFWQAGLFGSALANLYLPIALIYGWFRWGPDGDTRQVTYTKWYHYPLYLFVGVLGWYTTYAVAWSMGVQIPMLDSAILVLTVIAQFMMDNKKIECWLVWIGLNLIAITLYFQSGLFLAGVQYIVFLGTAVSALIAWRRSMGVVVTPYYTDDRHEFERSVL